jgi:predicted Zn finger-like uncharacterized protein
MPPTPAVCPNCGAQVLIAEGTVPGTEVRCPACSTVFASPAQSAGYEEPAGAAGVSSNYSLDLGRIFNRGWSSFSQGMGMLVGVTVVGLLISIPVFAIVIFLNLIPIVGALLGGVVNAAILAPVWSGLIIVALAQLRGRPWGFGDFFGGFRFWVPLFVYSLILSVISWVCALPANICLLLAGGGNQLKYVLQGQQPPPPDPTLTLLGQLLNLAAVVVIVIITVRYFLLCGYLIVDRNYSAIDAIKAHATLTQGHFFGWLGLALLFGLIGAAGALVCCVGLLFTIPLYFCLFTSAYLEATSASP